MFGSLLRYFSSNRPCTIRPDDPRLPSVWEPEERLWLIFGIGQTLSVGMLTFLILLGTRYWQLMDIMIEYISLISGILAVVGGIRGAYRGLREGARQREERRYIDDLPKEELERLLRAVKKAFHLRAWILIEPLRITRLDSGQVRVISNPQGTGLRGVLIMDEQTKEVIDEEWKDFAWGVDDLPH